MSYFIIEERRTIQSPLLAFSNASDNRKVLKYIPLPREASVDIHDLQQTPDPVITHYEKCVIPLVGQSVYDVFTGACPSIINCPTANISGMEIIGERERYLLQCLNSQSVIDLQASDIESKPLKKRVHITRARRLVLDQKAVSELSQEQQLLINPIERPFTYLIHESLAATLMALDLPDFKCIPLEEWHDSIVFDDPDLSD